MKFPAFHLIKSNLVLSLIAFAFLSAIPFLILLYFHSTLYHIFDIQSYLIVHNMIEFFSAIVSFSIFGIGWYSYDQSKNQQSLFLSISCLTIGMIDLMHTFAYLGMPDLITPNSENKSSQFWIVARLFSSITFLISGFIYRDKFISFISKRNLLISSLIFTSIIFITITFYQGELPDTFIKEKGLTSIKLYLEYLIIILFFIGTIVYAIRIQKTNDHSIFLFPFAFILCIIREFIFTAYQDVFDTYNLLGHIYKIVGAYIIYRAVFVCSVKVPYFELKKEFTEHLISKQKLTISLREKETLIRELYHRTKNTLYFIQSLLHLQSNQYNLNEDILDLVQKTDQRIQSVALVQEMLYNSNDLSQVNLNEYIKELTGLIFKSYLLEDNPVELHLEIENQNILLDNAIPLGLIINELITNSLKYAFPNNNLSIISLNIKSQDEFIYVNYSDNGIGLPKNFEFKNLTTLGAKLICLLSEEQMKGKISVESNNGFSFQLIFPINLHYARV